MYMHDPVAIQEVTGEEKFAQQCFYMISNLPRLEKKTTLSQVQIINPS